MKKAVIDPHRCDLSPFCPARRSCPLGAIKFEKGKYYVDDVLCIGCGKCLRYCPHRAIKMEEQR